MLKLLKQILCSLERWCVEPLGKPLVDRNQQIMCFPALALALPQPGEAGGGAELPEPGVLAAGYFDSLVEADLGLEGSSGFEKNLTLDAVEFGLKCSFRPLLRNTQRLVEYGGRFLVTASGYQGLGKKDEDHCRPSLLPGL